MKLIKGNGNGLEDFGNRSKRLDKHEMLIPGATRLITGLGLFGRVGGGSGYSRAVEKLLGRL